MSTATLAAPTSSASSATCHGASKSWATLTWVATASGFATGHTVSRSVNGGAYSLVAALSGRTTSSWVDSSISAKTTYAYRVAATYRSWTSAGAGASVTTGKNC